MTREEQLKYCNTCTKRAFNIKVGTICSLTNEKADFTSICEHYQEDAHEKKMEQLKIEEKSSDKKKGINKGRIALFLIAASYTLVGFYEGFYMINHNPIFAYIDWFFGLMFLGLGFLSLKKPYVSFLSGLIIYSSIHLLLAFVDINTLIQGLLMKVLIIVYLLYGLKVAKLERKNKKVQLDVLDQF